MRTLNMNVDWVPVGGGDGDVANGQRRGVGREDGLGRRHLVVL